MICIYDDEVRCIHLSTDSTAQDDPSRYLIGLYGRFSKRQYTEDCRTHFIMIFIIN